MGSADITSPSLPLSLSLSHLHLPLFGVTPSGPVRSSHFQGQWEEVPSLPLTPHPAKFLKGNHRFSAHWPSAGLELPSGTWAIALGNSRAKKSGGCHQRGRMDAVRGQRAAVPRNCQYQPSTLALVYENVEGEIRFPACSERPCVYW